MVADTVLVKEAGTAPEVLTSIANKAWSDVAYFLKVQPCSRTTCCISPDPMWLLTHVDVEQLWLHEHDQSRQVVICAAG